MCITGENNMDGNLDTVRNCKFDVLCAALAALAVLAVSYKRPSSFGLRGLGPFSTTSVKLNLGECPVAKRWR